MPNKVGCEPLTPEQKCKQKEMWEFYIEKEEFAIHEAERNIKQYKENIKRLYPHTQDER